VLSRHSALPASQPRPRCSIEDVIDKNRALSFGAVAREYHRFRPRTPPALLDWIVPTDAASCLDLAAGTGALTQLLVGRIASVTAVEPDPGMRAVLSAAVPQATVLSGTAEAIPLPDGCVDAVFVSSAWHWFDLELAVPEIARVLRSGGRLAVIGNRMDLRVDWVRALYQTESREPRDRRQLPPGSSFTDPESTELTWTQQVSVPDLIGLLGTYSQVIVSSAAEKSQLHDHALSVLADHNETRDRNVIEVPMRSVAWRATRCSATRI
jgi:SAM-dependent methyltransferase